MQPNPPNNEGYGQGHGPQYGQPYGQPEPQYGQPYGQPADRTSPNMYGQGDPSAAQPSAVPYSGQASAPPYDPNMYNQQPPPDYTQPFGAGGPPPPRSKGRGKKMGYLPLALLCGALVLVIGGVVALLVVQESGEQERKTANANANAQQSKGPVEECMVGKWKQVEYRKDVPLDDAGVGTVRMNGPEDGTAVEITIEKDGKYTEVWDDVIYKGTSKDGKAVQTRLTGEFTYVVRTEGGKLIKNQPDGEGAAYTDVDGVAKTRTPLDPTGGATTYACEGDNAFSFSDDKDYYNKFERVKE